MCNAISHGVVYEYTRYCSRMIPVYQYVIGWLSHSLGHVGGFRRRGLVVSPVLGHQYGCCRWVGTQAWIVRL
jgi:hypothetical protein